MIQVSRINGKSFVINCDLIKTLESIPDTLVTLTTGEKIMVKETVADVIRLTMDYRKRLFQEPPTTSGKS
jgi:flagellar protein FlbD